MKRFTPLACGLPLIVVSAAAALFAQQAADFDLFAVRTPSASRPVVTTPTLDEDGCFDLFCPAKCDPEVHEAIKGMFGPTQPGTSNDAGKDVKPPKDTRPVAYYWTADPKTCTPCRYFGADKAEIEKTIRLVDGRKQWPTWDHGQSVPAFAYQTQDGKWQWVVGYGDGRTKAEKRVADLTGKILRGVSRHEAY